MNKFKVGDYVRIITEPFKTSNNGVDFAITDYVTEKGGTRYNLVNFLVKMSFWMHEEHLEISPNAAV